MFFDGSAAWMAEMERLFSGRNAGARRGWDAAPPDTAAAAAAAAAELVASAIARRERGRGVGRAWGEESYGGRRLL